MLVIPSPGTSGIAARNLALLREGQRLVEDGRQAEITLRLLGGVAVLAHCPSLLDRSGFREIADIDAVVAPGQGRTLSRLLGQLGYEPESRFNALHGHQRLLFYGPLSQLDVMVGAFDMCHRIDLAPRLALDDPTISLSDLLLTKLQIVELNEKDAADALHLIADHELDRKEGDVVNLAYLDALAGTDWGLWRTMKGTLQRLRDLAEDAPTVARIDDIVESIDRTPKSLRWKLRARVGERISWYVLPDEVRDPTRPEGGAE